MKWVLVVVALLVGLLGGFFLASNTSDRLVEESENVLGDIKDSSTAESSIGAKEPFFGANELASINDSQFELYARFIEEVEQAHTNIAFIALADMIYHERRHVASSQIRLLVSRWIEFDVLACFDYIQSQEGSTRYRYLENFFEVFAAINPKRAIDLAEQIEDERQQSYALQLCLTLLSKSEPAVAAGLAWKHFGGDRSHVDYTLNRLYETWALSDPKAAGAAVLALDEGLAKSMAIQGVLAGMSKTDPSGAYTWLNSIPQSASTQRAKRQLFQNLVNVDLPAAKVFIASLTDLHARQEVLQGTYFGNATRDNADQLAEIFEWMGTVATGHLYEQKATQLIHSIMDVDPVLAAKMATDMPFGRARSSCLQAVAVNLLSKSPSEAMEFAIHLDDPIERVDVYRWMGSSLRNGGGERIAQWVLESDDAEMQGQLASGLAEGWAKYDRTAALSWAERLSHPKAKRDALHAVCSVWIQSEAPQAVAYIEANVEGQAQETLYRQAYGNWAWADPVSAAKGLRLLPEEVGASANRIYEDVALKYLTFNTMGASEWVSSLEAGLPRDHAVRQVVQSVAGSDPEAGFAWAVTIGDPRLRFENLKLSLEQWVRKDVEAAEKALEGVEMVAAERSQLFELFADAKKAE